MKVLTLVHKKIKEYYLLCLLIILMIAEYRYMFDPSVQAGIFWQPTILVIIGILIYVVSVFRSTDTYFPKFQKRQYTPISILVALSALSILLWSTSHSHIEHAIGLNPIDHRISDVIPATQLYAQRILDGVFPYEPMDFGWIVYPNYMPLRWLPYVPSVWLDIDVRLWTWGIYLTTCVGALWYMMRRGSDPLYLIIYIFSILGFNYFYSMHRADDLSKTVEFLTVAVYMILALGIFSRTWWCIALALAIATLSRFSFAIWAPFFVLLIWYLYDFTRATKIVSFVVLAVLAIYIIPFVLRQPDIFIEGMQYYGKAIVGEWTPQNWQALDAVPNSLNQSSGYAVFFWEMDHLSVEDRISLYGKVHLIACTSIMLLCSVVFYMFKHKIRYPILYALASLKIYLVVFYTFIAVPYIYLQVVNFIITIMLISIHPLAMDRLFSQRE